MFDHSRPFVVFILLWALCSVLNLTKAVHIDDTVSLLVARQISEHPLHPYIGKLNWSDSAGPTWTIAQPPLLFYLFAAWSSLFGESVFAAHALMSVITFGIICLFARLERLFEPNWRFVGLILLLLGPAFGPSQNLMTDVPVLLLWLAFFTFLFEPSPGARKDRALVTAGIFAGLACLVKYISAMLPAVLAVFALGRFRWKGLAICATPLLLLLGWATFSYFDYGGVHLSSKIQLPSVEKTARDTVEYIVCLGGVTPFSPLCLPALFRRKAALCLVGLVTVAGAFLYPSAFLSVDQAAEGQLLLSYLFWVNGLFVFSASLILLSRFSWPPSLSALASSNRAVLACWVLGNFLFIVIFAPYVATRHLLPALPAFVLIVCTEALPSCHRAFVGLILSLSSVLGIALSLSDWAYANTYRIAAPAIRSITGPAIPVVTVGHWGWQWYSEKEKMNFYDRDATELQTGDVFVIPEEIHAQELHDEQKGSLSICRRLVYPSSWITRIRLMAYAPLGGFYGESKLTGPWRISARPLQTFSIYLYVPPGHEDDPVVVERRANLCRSSA